MKLQRNKTLSTVALILILTVSAIMVSARFVNGFDKRKDLVFGTSFVGPEEGTWLRSIPHLKQNPAFLLFLVGLGTPILSAPV